MPGRTSRREGDEGGGGGGGKGHPHRSLPFLRNAGAFKAELSKKYLLPLQKQSTTPIVHYTFHYIKFIPVSAAVYREVNMSIFAFAQEDTFWEV